MNPLGLTPSTRLALVEAGSGRTSTSTELLASAAEVAETWGGARRLVLVLARNDLLGVCAYLGALDRGDAVVLIDDRTATDSVVELIRTYRPDVVVGPAGTAASMIQCGLPELNPVAVMNGEVVVTALGQAPALHPELAVLLSTSGTTGSRKLVRLSKDNISSNACAIARYLELRPDDRSITSLPFHYSFGLSVLNSHWAAQASVVLTTDSVLQASFWETMRTNAVTSMAGVPYTFEMLERVGFRSMQLPHLTTLQQAGGALDEKLVRHYAEHMARRDGRMFVMYGQTEATRSVRRGSRSRVVVCASTPRCRALRTARSSTKART
jgi:long-chain acyl-CoA synthetase